MDHDFLSVTYARILFRHLKLDASSGQDFFRGTDLDAEALMQLDRQISYAEQRQLFRNALRIHGAPGLGLSVGNALQIASHGPLGVAAMASPDLGTALQVFERYAGTRAQFVAIHMQAGGDALRMVFSERMALGDLHVFLMECVVSAMASAIGFFAGQGAFEGSVHFAYAAPAHADQYRRHFGVPVYFGSESTEVRLARGQLDLPSPVADASLHREAIAQCERELRALAEPEPSAAVRVAQLIEANPGRIWMLEEVAAHLHVSARTLIRKLKEEGTHFVGIRDRQAERLARNYLRDPGLTVADVGDLLGFSDTSSFRRSFKRWTGRTPAAYRDEVLDRLRNGSS